MLVPGTSRVSDEWRKEQKPWIPGNLVRGEKTIPVLVVLARDRACALRMTDIIETMRPLPVEALSEMPAFLQGISIIRGAPTPVIDLGTLLGSSMDARCTRFVTVRTDTRTAAFAVDSIVGSRSLDSGVFEELPPLLRDASGSVVEALGALNNRLLMLLRAGRLLPEEIWQALERQRSPGSPRAHT